MNKLINFGVGFIIIIIMNISPHKLIQEPQMRSCSSHLSNKNVLSSFRNESKLKDGCVWPDLHTL